MAPIPTPPPRSGLLPPNIAGVLWMLAAVTTLTAMMAVLKHLSKSLPVLEVGFFRMLMGLPFYLPWLLKVGWPGIRTERPGMHFVRGFFGCTSLLCMTYAVAHLILSDATVLTFTIPLWMIVFSALFMGEKVRLRRSLATLVGFAGVIMVVKPQGGVEPAAMVAIGGAVLATFAIISMKSLTRTDPPDRIVFYFLFTGSILLAPTAIWVWQWPTLADWLWLVVLGLFGSSGQFMLTRAYGKGELTLIAPLDFTRVVTAGVMGYFLFAELPDGWGIAGAAVIMASCGYIVRRDAMLKQVPPTPPGARPE
ncbi:MAG: EamA family transporter [Alphaproteobacteria bacterium]|nr:EamA family transporter [Alphaproteobacteria bacterium]